MSREFIVRGDGWEEKTHAYDIDYAVGEMVHRGLVSTVYEVSEDGGVTYRRVQWNPRGCGEVFPACEPPTVAEFIAAHPIALREMAEFALEYDGEYGVGDHGLQLAKLVISEQRRKGV